MCVQNFAGGESEIISRENLHMKLQDIKCKTSNQLNGFEQIFSDRFSGCGVKWPVGGFSRKCNLWVVATAMGAQMHKFRNYIKTHQESLSR